MKNITYKISKSMYLNLLTSKRDGGAGLNNDKEVFDYLNKTCGFKGRIALIQVE